MVRKRCCTARNEKASELNRLFRSYRLFRSSFPEQPEGISMQYKGSRDPKCRNQNKRQDRYQGWIGKIRERDRIEQIKCAKKTPDEGDESCPFPVFVEPIGHHWSRETRQGITNACRRSKQTWQLALSIPNEPHCPEHPKHLNAYNPVHRRDRQQFSERW